MSFTAAIIGRPNVGKSTLFNRLTGKHHALVDDQPGVTRDRREGEASLAGLEFKIFDTAGLDDAQDGTLAARMTGQTMAALDDADVVLMVIDGRAGVTTMDKHFAGLIRRGDKPVILVVNKCEGSKAAGGIAEAYSLGLGEPVPISAEHGEGLVELYDALAAFEKDFAGEDAQQRDENAPLAIAIVGRPNVGKSTLINHILGYDRLLTGPEAGITRDSIAVACEFEDHKIKLVDTAGMRRKSNIIDKVEKLAVTDTLRSIQYAEVVVLVIDAREPLEKQENAIAALVEKEGRAMVIAVNKWDEIDDKQAYLKAIQERADMVLPQVKGLPIVPISGKTGFNVGKMLKMCFRAHQFWNKEFTTGELNRWLERALEIHTPPLVRTRRIKIRYMVQKSARPPTFLLFSNTSEIPESYLRYLVNSMREEFKLPGVPIRIKIRKGANPYAEAKD